MNDHEKAAQWLLQVLPDAKIPFGEGANAPIVAKWLQDIATGKLVVSSPSEEGEVPPED